MIHHVGPLAILADPAQLHLLTCWMCSAVSQQVVKQHAVFALLLLLICQPCLYNDLFALTVLYRK